jgi:hypothetical protein
LRLVTNAKHTYPATEIMELSLAPLVERGLNRPALALAQLAEADERITRLLDQALQIASSQVE